ncbi:MAG: COX15/CtaA family protein [Pseudomonadales bacterium]
MNPRTLPGYKLAFAGTVLTLVVIMLGAFTRLVDAGLGCPDWPGCYGHLLWPETAAEIAAADAAFPTAPVETDKTWPEMVHRYFASSLGLVAIALVLLCWRARQTNSALAAQQTSHQPFKLTLLLLAVIVLQGLFGMWTVTLKLWPQVVTAHLLGGFATLCLFWLLTLRLRNQHWQCEMLILRQLQGYKLFALIALLTVIAQVALGGWTTSNYAAVACPDLPGCQGSWWPNADFAAGFDVTQQIGPNYLGGQLDNEARVAIHMAHRLGALVTTGLLLALCVKLLRDFRFQPLRKLAFTVLLVLSCQLGLGVANVLLHFPVAVAVAHNVTGALLLLSVFTLVYLLSTVEDALGERR